MEDDTDITLMVSVLEALYPEALNKIILFWKSPDIYDILTEMIMNPKTRNNRKGFCPQVMEELLFLHSLVDQPRARNKDYWG